MFRGPGGRAGRGPRGDAIGLGAPLRVAL